MESCFYGDIILWERPLQFWAEKILKPGDHVLDVGANVGGLTIAFARLVGEGGRVIGIEANPVLVDKIEGDIKTNNVTNASVVHGAAFATSGQTLDLYVDPSYYASGSSVVYAIPDTQKIAVQSVTIDEVCAQSNLRPRLIKLDIEGAELEALKGGVKTLATHQPFLIFESTSSEGELFDFLVSHGYTFFDTNTLEKAPKERTSAFPHNYVAVPQGSAFTVVAGAAESHKAKPSWAQSLLGTRAHSIHMAPAGGDYLLKIDFTAGPGGGQLQVHDSKGRMIMMYHASFAHLADSACSQFPLSLPAKDGPFRVAIKPDKGAKATLQEVVLTPLTLTKP